MDMCNVCMNILVEEMNSMVYVDLIPIGSIQYNSSQSVNR